MNTSKNLVPHILSAVSSTAEKRQSVDKIVKFVENRLRAEGKEINNDNLKDDIGKALDVANELGLITGDNNIVRLNFNPNPKPFLGFPSLDGQQASGRSLQAEPMEEDEFEDETTSEDNKTSDKTKPVKKTSICSVCALKARVRSRKRRLRGQSKRSRSRSRRRRRRH